MVQQAGWDEAVAVVQKREQRKNRPVPPERGEPVYGMRGARFERPLPRG